MNSPSSPGALPRIALLAITRQGVALAAQLARHWSGATNRSVADTS